MTANELKGIRMGWADAEGLARGTRAERRAIRRRVRKSGESLAPFWVHYRWMLVSRGEAFIDAIREGRLARTIAPGKLGYILRNG